jgi:hypothetical protein
MGPIRLVAAFGCTALLLSPAAALADFDLPVNPDRLNGTFSFADEDQGDNNTLEFQVEDRAAGLEGQVTANAVLDVVTIRYRIDFPSKFAGKEKSADVTQDRQVLVTLELVPGLGSSTPAYFGQAAPTHCKARGKVSDGQVNDPDDPEKADASLSCDLGSNWFELDDDADTGSAGDPPEEVLTAVEEAFGARPDVKVDTSKGKLQIKHRGEPIDE